ncbi:MAG: hypothetical protein AAGF25_05975, partial [Pseudomonadota bacterium]
MPEVEISTDQEEGTATHSHATNTRPKRSYTELKSDINRDELDQVVAFLIQDRGLSMKPAKAAKEFSRRDGGTFRINTRVTRKVIKNDLTQEQRQLRWDNACVTPIRRGVDYPTPDPNIPRKTYSNLIKAYDPQPLNRVKEFLTDGDGQYFGQRTAAKAYSGADGASIDITRNVPEKIIEKHFTDQEREARKQVITRGGKRNRKTYVSGETGEPLPHKTYKEMKTAVDKEPFEQVR